MRHSSRNGSTNTSDTLDAQASDMGPTDSRLLVSVREQVAAILTTLGGQPCAFLLDDDGTLLWIEGPDSAGFGTCVRVEQPDWLKLFRLPGNDALLNVSIGSTPRFASTRTGPYTCVVAPIVSRNGRLLALVGLADRDGAPVDRGALVALLARVTSQDLQRCQVSGEAPASDTSIPNWQGSPNADSVASALMESQQLLRDAQEIAHVGSWAWEVGSGVLTWSDELYRISGLDPAGARIDRRRATQLIHPQDRAAVEAMNKRLAATGGEFAYDHRIVRPDSQVRTVHCRGRAVVGREGAPGRVIGSVQDVTEWRAVEAALEASEARFRALNERAAIGIALTECDGRITHANPALTQMLGYRDADLIGLLRSDLTHDDDDAVQASGISRVIGGFSPAHSMEKRLLRKDGSVMWARSTVSAVSDKDGIVTHLIAVIEDISERRRAEEALRASESRYAHIAAHIPGVVYQYLYRDDNTHGFTFISDGVESLFGVTASDALADAAALLDRIHPLDAPDLARARHDAVTRRAPMEWEGRTLLPDGDVRWIHIASRLEENLDGTLIFDGLVTDITALRVATQRLEEREQHFRSLFDHNPDPVFSLDLTGMFVSANPACEAVSGFAAADLIGTSCLSMTFPEDTETIRTHLQAAARGVAGQYEGWIRHRSGHRVAVVITYIPILVGGEVVGVFGIAKDVSARKQLEAQLRQAQKMEAVGRLAGGVAHDFNNLLTVIQTYAELLRAQETVGSTARADLTEILTATDRAASLTRQLLAFSRQQLLQPAHIDANAAVTRVASMLRRVLGDDIQLESSLAPATAPVYADAAQLDQVLMNLAVNARDAMPTGGRLRLSTALVRGVHCVESGLTSDSCVAITVEDNGAGIAPDVLPRIFDPFFTTKGVGKGTGLGLATVYGIVEQSGGIVRVESTLGAGARFTVLLPAVNDGVVAVQPPLPAVIPTGTEHVLLVEDDPAVLTAIRRQLEQLGYRVTAATDGTDALRALRDDAAAFDLMLTDMVMPGMNGRHLGEEINKLTPFTRILYMSGYTDDEILRRGLSHGAPYLQKPFTSVHLAEAVRAAIDGTGYPGQRPNSIPSAIR